MARSYSVPSYSTFSIDRFKGVDLSVPEDQVKPYRTAWSQNMIPGEIGEIKKRPGVQSIGELSGNFEKRAKEQAIEAIGDFGFITSLDLYKIVENKYQKMVAYGIHGIFDNKCFKIAYVSEKPTVVKMDGRYVIFAMNEEALQVYGEEGLGYSYIGYLGQVADTYHSGALMTILEKGMVTVYNDHAQKATTNDGGDYWYCTEVGVDDPLLTVPVITKGADPAVGGSAFEQVNLLTPWVTESFCCKAKQTSVFNFISESPRIHPVNRLEEGPERFLSDNFRVEVLCAFEIDGMGTGEKQTIARWIERPFRKEIESQLQYGKDAYNQDANRLFLEPEWNKNIVYIEGEDMHLVNLGSEENDYWIGPTPVDGEDNVRITHRRADFTEGFRKLCASACGTVFGVGGYKDRLFLGGCHVEGKGYKDRIYYSELEDHFYIGDQNYLKPEDGCSVMALDGTSDVLAALTDRGIYMIHGRAQNNVDDVVQVHDAMFTISGKVLAPAPLHYGDTEVLGGEIVYLSKEGIIAVAYKEHFDERFAEHRSALIDPQMMKDEPQQLISLGRFLMVRCKDGVWWLLDENQPNAEGDKPYSSHQYEGWRLTGMPADAAWEKDGTLWLLSGSAVCKWTDGSQKDHYCDNYTGEKSGERAIVAYWDTPWIYGSAFHLDKNFIKMGILLGEISVKDGYGIVPIDSAVRIEMRKNDEDEKDWKILWDYNGVLCTFDYGRIDYRLFTYSGKPGCPDLEGKIKIKKAKRVKFRFSNDFINQGLILRRFCLNYVQEG